MSRPGHGASTGSAIRCNASLAVSEGACMEAIYYVMAWACHRRCRHCYEDRFRPYVRDELAAVVAEAEANFPEIIANLPARMT